MSDISFRRFSNSSTEDSSLNLSARPRDYSSANDIDDGSFDNAKLHLQVEYCGSKHAKIRNLIGFWLLGLCNNYAYVIMLSAAADILKQDFNHYSNNGTNVTTNSSDNSSRLCNPTSTGAILLADILPSLAIKMTAPFFIPGKHFRVVLVILLSSASFLLTSLSVAQWMSFLGVICAALSSGLGEVTFLSLSAHFDKNVVSAWSSGTGGAGILGSLAYAALTTAGLAPRVTLQIMLIMPVLLGISFWLVLVHPPSTKFKLRSLSNSFSSRSFNVQNQPDLAHPIDAVKGFTFREKISLTKPLLKYMIPLSLVYFAEYFINQGLHETIYFKGIWLNHDEQYRWYQVDYQLGVLISRSSVNCFKIKRLWVLPILQLINATFLFFVAYYQFLPSIWIVLAIVLYEGLLGGAAYVNTFYRISEEVPAQYREFSMGVASLGDSCGIAFAGAVSLPVHDVLCRLPPV